MLAKRSNQSRRTHLSSKQCGFRVIENTEGALLHRKKALRKLFRNISLLLGEEKTLSIQQFLQTHAKYSIPYSIPSSILRLPELDAWLRRDLLPVGYELAAPQCLTVCHVPSTSLSFAVGGAQNARNFSENIENGYIPHAQAITYEGVLNENYFNSSDGAFCRAKMGIEEFKLSTEAFFPKMSCGVTRESDGSGGLWMGLALDSNIDSARFQRPTLKAVFCLDISGSMSCNMDSYYYDPQGHIATGAEVGKSKLEVAKQLLIDLVLNDLHMDDEFAVVTFNTAAEVIQSTVKRKDLSKEEFIHRISRIQSEGGTNINCGYQAALDCLRRQSLPGIGVEEEDNINVVRKVFLLTDDQLSFGYDGEELVSMVAGASDDQIYTLVLGIGLDFNPVLVQRMRNLEGFQYRSVDSKKQLAETLKDSMTVGLCPLITKLKVSFSSDVLKLNQVYGNPDADKNTGDVMSISSLFAQSKKQGESLGGIILAALSPSQEGQSLSAAARLLLEGSTSSSKRDAEVPINIGSCNVSYYDNMKKQNVEFSAPVLISRYLINALAIGREGNITDGCNSQYLSRLHTATGEQYTFESPSLLKAVLLTKYVTLLRFLSIALRCLHAGLAPDTALRDASRTCRYASSESSVVGHYNGALVATGDTISHECQPVRFRDIESHLLSGQIAEHKSDLTSLIDTFAMYNDAISILPSESRSEVSDRTLLARELQTMQTFLSHWNEDGVVLMDDLHGLHAAGGTVVECATDPAVSSEPGYDLCGMEEVD